MTKVANDTNSFEISNDTMQTFNDNQHLQAINRNMGFSNDKGTALDWLKLDQPTDTFSTWLSHSAGALGLINRKLEILNFRLKRNVKIFLGEKFNKVVHEKLRDCVGIQNCGNDERVIRKTRDRPQ